LVVIFAATIIIAATLLTFELIVVESGLDDQPPTLLERHEPVTL
jgi:hypothetical protein